MKKCMLLLGTVAGLVLSGSVRAADPVDFAKQVLPILESNCFKCHNEKKQKADLRLDSPEAIIKGGENKVLVPSKAAESEIYKRITLPADHDDIMPPKGDPLTKAETDLIKAWIDQGASFGEWKGVPPSKAANKPKDLLSTLKTDPADPKALESMHKVGISAMPLASDVNLLTVNYRGVNGLDKADGSPLGLVGSVCGQLTWLNLAGSKVTDASLANLTCLANLTRLHLENTGIGDAGLAHLKGLANLEYLNLYNTKVTDAGLAQLKDLKHLKHLYVWQSKVTEAGAAELKKSLPKVAINLGWKEPPAKKETKPAETASAKTINATCPLTGKPVNPKFVVVYKGQKIGLCCKDCCAKFAKEPAKYIAKVKEFKEPTVAKAVAINAKCPFTGKPINAKFVVTYKGQKIGLCCKDCCAKFAKDPAKYIAKVKEFKDPGTPEVATINAKCPFTGKPVNPKFVVAYKGVKIGFCCGECCGKFAKNPDEHAGKVKEFVALQKKKAAAAKPVNKVCPFSGKPIDPKVAFTYKDVKIGFCCSTCCGKFAEKPDEHIAKVKELQHQAKADGPINKVCPLTGKPINAKFVVAYKGQKIALCCGECCKKFAADPAAFIAKVPEFKAPAK